LITVTALILAGGERKTGSDFNGLKVEMLPVWYLLFSYLK
tara:strand:- start:17466 stop:17585 length:120 start_codon:yes stop_codon:yes gene_type:complete